MKKPLTSEELMGWWLLKYHNKTIEQVLEECPEASISPDWYLKYPVTKEQHDEWYEWVIDRIMKYFHITKKAAVRYFALPYINLAPSVK